jgi:hypothetical protein
MLKIAYTSRKFFGKFAYRLTIAAKGNNVWWRGHERGEMLNPNVNKWIKTHMPDANCKVCVRYQSSTDSETNYHTMVYLSDEKSNNKLLTEFASHTIEVCQPLNKEHEQNLEIKNTIEVRKTLIYKKYSHVIYFKYDRSGDLGKWIKKELKSDLKNGTIKWSGNASWNTLYFQSTEDMTMIKLMWSENIDRMKTVVLLNPPT